MTTGVVALLGLLPFVVLTATSFVKISVVLSVLRNALGTGQVPSGAVITALSLLLTLFIMAPVGEEMAARAAPVLERVDLREPLGGAGLGNLGEVLSTAAEPLERFLERHAGARERALFADLAAKVAPAGPPVDARSFRILLPAFLITELAEAFQIAFLVFLPFLVLDLLVANVLLALGMHMMSPSAVAMPFKLLLFVLVDGWFLLIQALVLGYSQ